MQAWRKDTKSPKCPLWDPSGSPGLSGLSGLLDSSDSPDSYFASVAFGGSFTYIAIRGNANFPLMSSMTFTWQV